jgi:hypothetical protein
VGVSLGIFSIGSIDDTLSRAAFKDAIAKGTARMGKWEGAETPVVGVVPLRGGEVGKGNRGGQIIEVYREKARVLLEHKPFAHVGIGARNGEGCTWEKGGDKKGKALDVVPVGVGEQEGEVAKGEGCASAQEVETEQTESRASVEDKAMGTRTQFHTGGIAANSAGDSWGEPLEIGFDSRRVSEINPMRSL